FLAGVLLERFAPWAPQWTQLPATHWIGWFLFAVGIILGPGSAALFGLRRTTLNPTGRPSRLVADNAFSISRNPMYLGLTITYIGLSLALGRVWPLVLLLVPVLLMNAVVIPFEEARMRETFGADYLAYSRRVRRWV
ncbi:MAG: isoprenylcysteine carboxylmethyltransferase family protein, partial [Pseudomonadota bacterium]